MSSAIIPPDGSIPYLYIFLLTSSLISAGVSLGNILTKGQKPVMKKCPSFKFKFAKACIMFLCKFIVQGYILTISVTCLLFKFMSKVLYKYKTEFLSKILLRSSNTLLTPRMTLRPIVNLQSTGGRASVYHTSKEVTISAMNQPLCWDL